MALFVKLIALLQRIVIVAIRILLGCFRFVWQLIPSHGNIFGLPAFIVKSFVVSILISAILNSCIGKICTNRRRCVAGGEENRSVKCNQVQPSSTEPVSGRARYYCNGEELSSLLRVTASGCSCLVEIIERGSSKVVVDVFIKEGRTEDVKVPVGRYEVRYAAGHAWTGGPSPFGSGTYYSSRPGQSVQFEKGAVVSLRIGR